MYAANKGLTGRTWLDVAPTSGNTKLKKQKRNAIKWDLFQRILKIELDEFWHPYWDRASKGRFPNGFFFNGQSLTYISRNNTYEANIKSDTEANLKLMKHMFQTYGRIHSPDDLEIISRKENINVEEKEFEELEWKSYNKMQQNSMILSFVKKTSKIREMNETDEKRMMQTIKINLTIGRLRKEDVILVNGEISEIQNLLWDDELKGYYVDGPPLPNPKRVNKKSNKVDYGEHPHWNKWIRTVREGKKVKEKVMEIDINDDTNEFSSTIC